MSVMCPGIPFGSVGENDLSKRAERECPIPISSGRRRAHRSADLRSLPVMSPPFRYVWSRRRTRVTMTASAARSWFLRPNLRGEDELLGPRAVGRLVRDAQHLLRIVDSC